MQLEQWEIDLIKQFGETKNIDVKKVEKTNKDDYLYYFSVGLFFCLASLFFLDLKFDLINFVFQKKSNNFKVYSVEEKIDLLKEVINKNFSKLDKDLIIIQEDWSTKN